MNSRELIDLGGVIDPLRYAALRGSKIFVRRGASSHTAEKLGSH
jgi:hypothetical protein